EVLFSAAMSRVRRSVLSSFLPYCASGVLHLLSFPTRRSSDLEGLVEIGNTGRALKETEIEKYGLVSFPFAIDGVAVVVNPQNNRSEEHTSELQSRFDLVCRLLLEKKN